MDAKPAPPTDMDEVERIDVSAVNKSGERTLYAPRERIHPKRAEGRFRHIKWAVMAATLSVYYFTPWIRWDRGPTAPDQAVLIDFPARRFYFFFIEIWPQEVYYLTGLLILAAMGLFLITSLAGRVWCGYTCPQTVWTDLFLVVERFVEGDRNARLRLDRTPWNSAKIGKKLVKHIIWILIAIATGGAWVFYFADAPILAGQLARFEAPVTAYGFVGLFAATTYLLGAIAREQVCIYMCPWPRIQGAMLDEESLVVTYHADRGDPRGSHKQGEGWEDRGHCVDCNQCVAVCPTGIDIRDGQQLECITCALCIDACNGIMEKVGLPAGLISYDTHANMERRTKGEKPRLRLLRPRVLLYASVMMIVGLIMLFTLIGRSDLDMNVLRDRNPVFVQLADGGVRNAFTVKVLNKRHQTRRLDLLVSGLFGARLRVIGQVDESQQLTVPPDQLRSFRVLVSVPPGTLTANSQPLTFSVADTEGGTTATYEAVFRGPAIK
ncbi:MAG: cytochrome c oxidase accessory protein CcoG [Rhodospirillaceae bacterium]|jgi:cytochrome c oxidase accessory protein FixG|nr:cytochrome c oxidase accessory protein CcoG [Rhodospirillaceae bacterium]MBT5456080.1 cytochrome c oxidase accessory protein CcoG [Rhodospirillaceae bacterium]